LVPTHERHIASDHGDVRSIQPNRTVSGTGLVRRSARANAPATSTAPPGHQPAPRRSALPNRQSRIGPD
jgi:hypothetical protein